MAEQENRVRIIRVVGGKRQELELSASRARELGITSGKPRRLSVPYLFDGVLAWHRTGQRQGTACPRCGTTQREMVLYRRAGCAHCYEVFHRTVERLLQLDRSSATHRGRVPRRLDRFRRMFVEREELLSDLDRAVQAENFEAAASLRDRLQAIDLDDVEA